MLEPLSEGFVAARDGMHALAEHVLAPFRHRADGHIGLLVTPGGFGTPTSAEGERVRVDGVELVHERPGTSTRVRITTLGAAAQFVGVPLGAPTEVFTPTTPCTPDAPIALDVESTLALAAWIALGESVLCELREAYAAHEPTSPILWPEHFDLALELGHADAGTRATYGASPGDATIPRPYLYVAPGDTGRRTGKLSGYPFGAALTYDEMQAAGDAKGAGMDFLFDGAALLLGQP